MKKQGLLLFVSLITIHYSLFAQPEVVQRVTDLIVLKKQPEATRYLDSLLKKNPENVDAWMMKGNVLLNFAMDTTQSMNFISETDESVFTVGITPKAKLLSEKTVREVETCWRKALQLDSLRVDVRKGLCTIYTLALMKDSLKTEILRLRKMVGDEDEEAFKMCEYARKFKERNRFNEAMELYAYIANLYPQAAGIRCDMASEYFYEGKMNEALLWLDSTYKFKTVDETSFLNGAFVFSQLGYFDNAQSVLNAYSRIYNRRMDDFYFGLTLFADSSDKYTEVLKAFISEIDSNSYYTEFVLAKQLLSYRTAFTFENYRALAISADVPDYYKVLIHFRGMKQFTNKCEPYFMYGIYSALIKNYSASVQFLEDVEQCRLPPKQTEYWKLSYAFVLYKTNQQEKAKQYFGQLFSSSNIFYSQAAKYFSAKILTAESKNAEAKILYQQLAGAKERTKFAELSVARLK